jgi:hypothetical protein
MPSSWWGGSKYVFVPLLYVCNLLTRRESFDSVSIVQRGEDLLRLD